MFDIKNPSTRKAVRTAFQVLVAAAAVILVVVPALNLPAGTAATVAGALVSIATLVTKVMNALEAKGVIPALFTPSETVAEEPAADTSETPTEDAVDVPAPDTETPEPATEETTEAPAEETFDELTAEDPDVAPAVD